MSKRRERTTSAISAGRKKRQKVARSSERDEGLLQDFSEDDSDSKSQENVTSGGVSSHVFPSSHSDAPSQEAEGNETSEPSELEHEGEDETTDEGGDDDNERTSGASRYEDGESSVSGDTESESDDNTDSASSYHLSESEDDGSSIRTVRPRTRNQIRYSDVESEASIIGENGHDDALSLTQQSDQEVGSYFPAQRPSEEISNDEVAGAENLHSGFSTGAEVPDLRFPVLVGEYMGEREFLAEPRDDEGEEEDVDQSPETITEKVTRRSKKSKTPPSEHEKAELRKLFKINHEDMQSTAGKIRFPYFPDPLPVGAKIPEKLPEKSGISTENVPKPVIRKTHRLSGGGDRQKPRDYEASTITQEQMRGRGLWEFLTIDAWDRQAPPTRPPLYYQPLQIVKDRPANQIFDPPIEPTAMLNKKTRPHGNLQLHFNWIKYFFEGGCMLYIATELLKPKGLGKRPVLPDEYEAALLQDHASHKVPTRQREETPTPGYGPSAESSPVKQASYKFEQSDLDEDLSHRLTEHAEDESVTAPRKAKDSWTDTSLADEYIKKHNLSCSKSAAEKVAKYLEPFQSPHDLEDCKRRLAELIGNHGNSRSDQKNKIDFIQCLPSDVIKARHEGDHYGTLIVDEASPGAELFAVEKAIQWLEFTGKNIAPVKYPSEVEVEQEVGRLLRGFFASPKCSQTANQDLKLQQHLRLFGTTPRPDLAVRPCKNILENWNDQLRCCLCCGDAKVLVDKPETKWVAQLAMAMGPTLNLLTLIHLDTRQEAHAQMPHWMWVPGIIFTQRGFTMYAHHPGVFVTRTGEWKWKHVSVEISSKFSHIYPAPVGSGRQAQALCAMCTVRYQIRFVLEQIESWEEARGLFGQGVMDQFIARAQYDRGNWEWLREKAKTYKAPL